MKHEKKYGIQKNSRAIEMPGKHWEGQKRLVLFKNSTPSSHTNSLFDLRYLLKESRKTARKPVQMKFHCNSKKKVAELIQAYGKPAVAAENTEQFLRSQKLFSRSICRRSRLLINQPPCGVGRRLIETSCSNRIPQIPFICFDCNPSSFNIVPEKEDHRLSKIEEEQDISHYEEILRVRKLEDRAVQIIQKAFRKHLRMKRNKKLIPPIEKYKKNVIAIPLKRNKLQAISNVGNITLSNPKFSTVCSKRSKKSFANLDFGTLSLRSPRKSNGEERENSEKENHREPLSGVFRNFRETKKYSGLSPRNIQNFPCPKSCKQLHKI